ncbi:MAG: RHS repeat-associated core domain-containing protein [Kamptonema sp. SIO1D9]|nr:RHS repeat-associated core domain-containing protein [Kamptonema sp. SIO1D9]
MFTEKWLEESTDLYHFRARYYDPEVGRFISRDPVDIIETAPESSNLYQFVYNNPLIYLDPTGEFTISELNASQNIQTQLANVRRYAGSQAKDYLLEKIGEAFGNIVSSTFEGFLPSASSGIFNEIISGKSSFEEAIQGEICKQFDGLPLSNNLYMATRINNGVPQDNGLNCGNYNQQQPNTRLARRRQNLPGSKPDFMFRNTPPLSARSKDPGAYLVGDLKTYLGHLRTILQSNTRENRQWLNMSEYAKKYQFLPFVSYLALSDSNIINPSQADSNGLSGTQKKQLAAEAIAQGIILILINLIEK